MSEISPKPFADLDGVAHTSARCILFVDVRLEKPLEVAEDGLGYTGYRGDGTKCKDIDECEEGTAHCDQICVNDIGGYHCECKDGFKLVSLTSSV